MLVFSMKHRYVLLLLVFVISCTGKKTLFKLIPSDHSQVNFANTITQNDSMNILDFEYVFNGAGVGIGDFNNDGLQDLFFSGNMVPNKLYLNKGDFKFLDISEIAGIEAPTRWSSGVCVVDINQDGLPDIYVCATTYTSDAAKANMMFINNGPNADGIPTFTDMAYPMGIDDKGSSTQAAFFDYDNDGDLDLYILTNRWVRRPNRYRPKLTDGSDPSTDRLYKNNGNGTFTNVSREAGILKEGYGLGLSIVDVNQDGWEDIYATNDFVTNDLLYINNHDGTFTDHTNDYFKHTSHSAMGQDIADINNDELPDFFALEMMPEDNKRQKMMMMSNNYQTYVNNEKYGYNYQYARNTLQLNNGYPQDSTHPDFSEISYLAGVSGTDWSWSPLLVDFDNDGFRDLFITNGFPMDITDHDFLNYRIRVLGVASSAMLLEMIPEVKLHNYAFRNNGNLTFENVTNDWGLNYVSFSNGAAFVDLDNDGDLDYVVNNIDDPAFIYENQLIQKGKPIESHFLEISLKGNQGNLNGLGAKVILNYDSGKVQYEDHATCRGYLSSVSSDLHFGLGKQVKIDSIQVYWLGGKYQVLKNITADNKLIIDIKNAKEASPGTLVQQLRPKVEPIFQEIHDNTGIHYTHHEKDFVDYVYQNTLPHKFSQYGPGIAVGDVNGDKLEDFYVSGSNGNSGQFFLQNGKGVFFPHPLTDIDSLMQNEELGSLLFDADNDGDLDLYVVSGGYEFPPGAHLYQDRLYVNDGKGNFRFEPNALPEFTESGLAVKAADFDHDGYLDLFVGGRVVPREYPKPVTSRLLLNESEKGHPRFRDVTAEIAPRLLDLGLVTDALWTDVDNDGWIDLLISGAWMPLTILQNHRGKFTELNDTGLQTYSGWWNSLVSGDFDQDGDLDYMAGNLGLNSFNKATSEYPATAYANDFDKNGSYDVVLFDYRKNENGKMVLYPVNMLDDILRQMNFLRKKFTKYEYYARATADSIFTPEQMRGAQILQASQLQSCYVENKGNGKFELKTLPIKAQIAPMYGMVSGDFNADGNLDVLAVGNDFGTELFIGRYDASFGYFLAGDGEGNFNEIAHTITGFNVPGDGTALAGLKRKDHLLLIAGQNNAALKVFEPLKMNIQLVEVPPNAQYALVNHQDGHIEKVEFYYGSSYLSQSSRVLMINKTVRSWQIFSATGQEIVDSDHLN